MKSLSVCITTRNNLEYLKLCLRGLKKYSLPETEILIHVDGSTDGTIEWLKKSELTFSRSDWKGSYSGWNSAVSRASNPYIILYSDDMFPAPEWDKNMLEWVREDRIIVPRLVEPSPGSYPPAYDCGRNSASFDETKFVQYAKKISEKKLVVHTFGAFAMSVKHFRDVGGFDTRFDPVGVGSIDFIMTLSERYGIKFYEARDVLLYHFQCVAVSKISNKDELDRRSVKRFEEKWGFGIGPAYQRLEERQNELLGS